MNTAENPPRNNENEVEKFDASPVSSETEFKSYKIMDDKEKEFFIASEKAKIQELRGQLVEKFEDTRDPQERQEAPVEVHPPKKQESGFGKKMKKWMMTLGFVGVAATGSAKAADTEKNFSDSTTTTKEMKQKESTVSKTSKNTVPLYTQSKTPEGGITPTGYSNSFYENEYGITEDDIEDIAAKYNFSTKNALAFQTDMFKFVQEKNPEVIDGVLKKFGPTNQGEGIQGLLDDRFGRRTAFIAGFLKHGSAELTIDGKKITYSTATPDSLEGGPNPSGGEFFSTDGYEKLVVLFDNSPSMYKNRGFLAEKLSSNHSDVPVEVTAFSNKADALMTFATPAQASTELAKIAIVDQNKELAVDVLRDKLQSMEVQSGKTKIVVCTDEKLQDVSQEKLADIQKLSTEKNIDVVFSVIIDDKPYTLTMEDIQESFTTLITGFTKSIEIREKQIQEFQAEIDQTSSQKKKKDLEKQIEENRFQIKYFQDFLDGVSQVDLSSFDKDPNAQSIASK